MNKKSLLVRLRSQTAVLSPKLRVVADYVVKQPAKVQFQTITELAKMTKTSEASVIRMCRDFGFKGYSDFRMALAKDLSSSGATVESIDNGDIFKTSSIMAITALKDTEELIDRKVIDSVCELLHKSKYVSCVAVGASSIIGDYLAYRLIRVGKSCICYSDTHLATMNAIRDDDEMWFAVSSSGSSKEVVHVATQVNASRSSLVAISNIYHSPLASLANFTLVAARPEGPLTGGAFSSKVGGMLIVDVIVNRLIEMYPQYQQEFSQTAEATMDLMI